MYYSQIPTNSQYKLYWDIYILTLAIFICYMLPVELCIHPKFGESKWWKPVESFIEAFFCLDVLVHFNTSIYDHDGNETFSKMHIAHHYLTSHEFWIDMLSTIPIPVVTLILFHVFIELTHCKVVSHFESNTYY